MTTAGSSGRAFNQSGPLVTLVLVRFRAHTAPKWISFWNNILCWICGLDVAVKSQLLARRKHSADEAAE
jgi:hypothetical protein